MYLTLESDYAIRIAVLLAQRKEKTDAKTISALTNVTFRFTLKILHKLVDGGLVSSYQGAKGGYLLAKAPEDITLYDIICLTESGLAMSRCLLGDYPCNMEGEAAHTPCRLQKTFSRITDVMNAELAKVSIADLL